jgi:hypothetical protein
MIVGVDTFATHLDLITWADVTTWNNGTAVAFAGRNFLAKDFLWGHGEATNALTNPDPNHPQNLAVTVPLIAPIQAPQPDRQQFEGRLGSLFGEIDGRAICARLAWSIAAGEFQVQATRLALVWLAVDPTVALSVDYWAGWSSAVNHFASSSVGATLAGNPAPLARPFLPCILCRYTADTAGAWHPDPHVRAVITNPGPGGYTPFALWADAPDPDPNGVRPNPVLNWTQFSAATSPLIWRFSTGIRQADNSPVNAAYNVDVLLVPPAVPRDARDYMLSAQAWQTSRTGVRVGFSNNQVATNDQLNNCILAMDLPPMTDSTHVQVDGGQVRFLGRYIKMHGAAAASITRNEAERASNGSVPLFTIWENVNTLAHGEPVWPDPQHPNPLHIGIQYFDPVSHAGTEDGREAFTFAGRQLRQPPHTPIFFAIDGDPNWTHVIAPHAVPPQTEGDWIVGYFTLIHAQRAAWVAANPARPYLIGVYGGGRVLRELYTRGIVDMYWQAMSPGFDESQPAHSWWPWPHLNRWQYNGDQTFACAVGPSMTGIDPDADWGDGGTWLVTDPLEVQLERAEDAAAHVIQLWGTLLNDL